nr:MAG TPA: hypothetical protein [Bacteriophage sp.]
MTLTYGIIVALAAIVGSVAGRIVINLFAKRRAEKLFEKWATKTLEEASEEIIKEMDKLKDIERTQLYEAIKLEQERGCWESYEIQKNLRGYFILLIGPHGAKAIDIPQSFTDDDLFDLRRHLFNCKYKRLERM